MIFSRLHVLACSLALIASGQSWGQGPVSEPIVVEPRLVHLRHGAPREWSSFPETAEAAHLEVKFTAARNSAEHTLRYRQVDVKQTWRVLVNGKSLGELVRDEADTVIYLPIAPGLLVEGENTLRIEASRESNPADDIRVGQISISPQTVKEALSKATLEIEVVDAATGNSTAARITITDQDGALHTTAARSDDRLAVRPGVIYTSDGKARFGVPAGKYTIYAGRGFEYSLARVDATAAAGQIGKHNLAIRREVPTPGYVACDTHIHTLTYSGHGDASIDERMITLAGEGIELPIATEHNVQIDYEMHAQRLGVRQYFTPVVGNEVTTTVGHFNIFPARAGGQAPNHRLKEWGAIFDEIFAAPEVKIAILNHARDLHSGVRPFGPDRFNDVTGENLDGWPMRFNAMEIINSGATQTDPLRLTHDWMALLNRGYHVTPVGSSDSHDVARYIVGQGRTYFRCEDADAGKLNVQEAVANFHQGRVLVSYGLLAEMTVNDKFASGDLATVEGDHVKVALRVLGPHWTTATSVQLYANGQLVRDEKLAPPNASELPAGIQGQKIWTLPRPKHDVCLVAVALGAGVDAPYWPTAKPYQPTSSDWEPKTLGVSGAVWIDGDGDGRRSCARDYAESVLAASGDDAERLLDSLAKYDFAVAAQAASLCRSKGGALNEAFEKAAPAAPPHVMAGIKAFRSAWRTSEIARAKR